MKRKPKLASLAQLTTSIDEFHPETCLVVGNYYSCIGKHEKAICLFMRALDLDRKLDSAWMLLGQEYSELDKPHPAIEAYRRAVALDRKDYYSWQGLAHSYQILGLHHFGLYYYSRAAILRPNDEEVWQDLGMCLSHVEEPASAVKALKRALAPTISFGLDKSFADLEGDSKTMNPRILYQLSLLYEQMGNRDEAVAYMQLCLVNCEEGEHHVRKFGARNESATDTCANGQ